MSWSEKHVTKAHERQNNDSGSIEFQCDRGNCGKFFANRGALRHHLNLHDNNVVKCYFCPWGAPLGKTLNISTHLNQHLGTPEYECPFCERRFYRKDHVLIHCEIYHEKIEGKYRCKFCEYKTHSRAALSDHKTRNHKNQI